MATITVAVFSCTTRSGRPESVLRRGRYELATWTVPTGRVSSPWWSSAVRKPIRCGLPAKAAATAEPRSPHTAWVPSAPMGGAERRAPCHSIDQALDGETA